MLKRLFAYTGYAALVLALLCGFTLLICGPGVRFDLWSYKVGLKLLTWSIYGGMGAIGLALLHTGLNKLTGVRTSQKTFGIPMGIGLIGAIILYIYIQPFYQYDTLADATTDFDNPPVFVDLVPIRAKTAKNPLEYRGDEATLQQRDYFPEIAGLETNQSPEKIILLATDVIQEMGLELIAAAPAEGRLEATATTFWFGYRDDLIVRVTRRNDQQSRIDVRSASRVGYGDGGSNAKRIIKFLSLLKNKLQP